MKINEKTRSLVLMSIFLAGMIQFSGCAKKTDMQSIIAADESITRSCKMFAENINRSFNSIRRDYAITPKKAKKEYDKAVIVMDASYELIDFILYLKQTIISESDGRSINKIAELDEATRSKGESILPSIDGKEDKQKPGDVLFRGKSSNFEQLENKLKLYKDKIIEILGPKHINRLHLGLEINKSDYKNQSVASVVLMLNTLLMEILNTQYETIAILYSMIDEERYNFSNIKAVVVPEKEHVREGEKFEAEIFITAYDTTFNHRVKVGSDIDYETLEIEGPVQNLTMENGVCKYSVVASGKGEKTIFGRFEVLSRNGTITIFPFKYSYYVE